MDKVDYREILRLQSLGYSLRSICQSVHSSHHTVSDVLDSAARHNITWPLDSDITNLELGLLLFPEKSSFMSIYVEPGYEYIHHELARTGVTLTLLWEEYCRKPRRCHPFQPGPRCVFRHSDCGKPGAYRRKIIGILHISGYVRGLSVRNVESRFRVFQQSYERKPESPKQRMIFRRKILRFA